MRTHYLREIAIAGKEIVLAVLPDFDFYNLGQILHLKWETCCDNIVDAPSAVMNLRVGYRDKGMAASKFEVTFRFIDVVRVKLDELRPLMHFAEVEIEDLSDSQLENIRFAFNDFGACRFTVECKAIEMFDFRAVE